MKNFRSNLVSILIVGLIWGSLLMLLWGLVRPRVGGPYPLITETLSPPSGDPSILWSHYRQLDLVTPDPYIISPEVWLSCMAPTLQEESLLQSEHAGLAVRLFANEEAMPILQEKGDRTFPIGSIIVKEKLRNANDTEPTALGMMIKRSPGFDPTTNDWEFAYWLQDGTLIEGNEALSNCVRCHREQQTTDMVFWTTEP